MWDGTIDYGGYVVSATITCIAIFKKGKESTITVRTSASPVAGGTTTPTSETRTGKVGQSETFTLVATANKGYEFKRWEDDGGSLVSKSKTTSVTKTYTENPQTFNYTAIFRKLTGLILRNDSGTILHGSGGTILRDE